MAQRQFRSDDTDRWTYGFGNGIDGDLIISTNTTDLPIIASCSATAGTTSISATNSSFQAGQLILIHQARSLTVPGVWELNAIKSYTSGTITTIFPLCNTYTTGTSTQVARAQVMVLKQYRNVTIDSSYSFTGKDWDGSTGGILGFFVKGTLTNNGTTHHNGEAGKVKTNDTYPDTSPSLGGFRGHSGATASGDGIATGGESYAYSGVYGEENSPPWSGDWNNGSGTSGGAGRSVGYNTDQSGGGGSYGAAGTAGTGGSNSSNNGHAGSTGGVAGLTTLLFGGSGGPGTNTSTDRNKSCGGGGAGGGIILVIASKIVNAATLSVNGGTGGNGYNSSDGGSGSGGSILMKCNTADLGTNIVQAVGGYATGSGGAGGAGRIHIDYSTSYTGTTSPTIDARQDTTLVSSVFHGGII